VQASWLLSVGIHGALVAVFLALAPVAARLRDEEPVVLSAAVCDARPIVYPEPRRDLFRQPAPAQDEPVPAELAAEPIQQDIVEPQRIAVRVEHGDAPELIVPDALSAPRREPLAGNPLPPYPRAARRAGIEGRVLVRLFVSGSGAVERVEVAESSGSALLDEAACGTLKRWRFRPARGGQEAAVHAVLVPVIFRLEEGKR